MRTCCEICSASIPAQRLYFAPHAITCSVECGLRLRRRKEQNRKRDRFMCDPAYREKCYARQRAKPAVRRCVICDITLPQGSGPKKFCSPECRLVNDNQKRERRIANKSPCERIRPIAHVPTKEEVEARREDARRAARDYYAANREKIIATKRAFREQRRDREIRDRENERARARRARKSLALKIISQMGYDQ